MNRSSWRNAMSIPGPYGDIRHPFGLPMGTVRGFISLLICSFFWIYLLLPAPADQRPLTVPLAHFFLLSLVFLAFASHPILHDAQRSEFLPWLMRFIFVRKSDLFQSLRAWVGIVAILLLVIETVYQFAIRPSLAQPPGPEAMKVWEGIIIAFVAAYFGSRA